MMNDDIKICPYCGQKIKAIAKKCRFCGKWFDTETKKENLKEKTEIKYNEKQKNKPEKQVDKFMVFLLLFIFLPAIVFILIRPFLINYYPSKAFVSSCTPVDYETNNFTFREVLENLSTEENEFKNYINGKISNKAKEDAFFTYINSINCYAEIFDQVNYKQDENFDNTITTFNQYLSNGNSTYIGGLLIEPVEFDYRNNCPLVRIKIKEPNVPTVRTVFNEGYFELVPDFNYLYTTYNSLVNKELKDYLFIKAKEQTDLGNYSYTNDGYLVATMQELTSWINEWQKFLNKYPKFSHRKEIEHDIQLYTWYFLSGESFYNVGKPITESEKDEFKMFLATIDKNSEAYKTVNDAFKILAQNDYINCNEYLNFVGNYANKYNFSPRH